MDDITRRREEVRRVAEGFGARDAAATQRYDRSSPESPMPLGRRIKVPTFPDDTLPGWVGDYVRAVAESTQTPLDLPGMLGLAALATAAARKVRVEPRPGWSEAVNLYVVVAMAPGSRKSPMFDKMTAPLMGYEREAVGEARPHISDAATRKRIAEDAARQAEKKAGRATGANRDDLIARAVCASLSAEDIVVPASPRLLADDATAEAVASLLAEQGGRMAILSAEGDLFDLIAGRYSKTPNLGVFLKAWNGDDVRVDRKGRMSRNQRSPLA
jgi:hypothetical protein